MTSVWPWPLAYLQLAVGILSLTHSLYLVYSTVTVDAEILRPVFHLQCSAWSTCTHDTCCHEFHLNKDHKKKVDELPMILFFIRRGWY